MLPPADARNLLYRMLTGGYLSLQVSAGLSLACVWACGHAHFDGPMGRAG
jgi:hypothetical protein